MAAFLAARAEPRELLLTSEDAVVAKVGRELYERLFRGYTRKQWGLDPSELHAQVCARIPVRTNTDDRYFGDTFQYMPADGYTAMFERILDHPNIEVRTGVEFERRARRLPPPRVDRPDRRLLRAALRRAALPQPALRDRDASPTPRGELVQDVAVINHPAEATPYTRVTEYRHLTGQRHTASTLHYEFPSAEGDPYYPVPRPENRRLYERYAALAADERDVTFVGRLARYQYLNMDQVVGQALATFASAFARELAYA